MWLCPPNLGGMDFFDAYILDPMSVLISGPLKAPGPASDMSGGGSCTSSLGEGLDRREVRRDFKDILALCAEGCVTKA